MAPDALLRFLGPPHSSPTALAALRDPLRSWFVQRFGEPTAAQLLAWPALRGQGNLLLSSPTGSGKTLAAFLPIIDQMLAGCCADGVLCLYIAPLRALVADAG